MLNESMNWSSVGRGKHGEPSHECGHIFTTYILPDIFHCVAFLIGLIYFRITEGESVYSLMEKVIIPIEEFSPNDSLTLIRFLSMLIKIFVPRIQIE